MAESKKEFDIIDLTTQASKFIEKNFKAALAGFVVLIFLGTAWVVKTNADRQSEMDAFTELYKTTKTYQKKKADFAEAKAESEKKPDPKAPKTENKDLALATGDMTKDYGPEVEQLTAFIQNHGGSNASGEAALILSEIYGEYDEPLKGAEVLETTLAKWGSESVLSNIMNMRAGDLWASANECDKAVSRWQVVANAESFVAPQAQLKMGVCLQELGRFDEARNWFERIEKESPNSTEGFSAKRYLRFLEFKSNTKEGVDSTGKAQQKSKNSETQS